MKDYLAKISLRKVLDECLIKFFTNRICVLPIMLIFWLALHIGQGKVYMCCVVPTLQRWCKMLRILYSTNPFIISGQPLRSKIHYQEKDVKKRVTYDPKLKQGSCFYRYNPFTFFKAYKH